MVHYFSVGRSELQKHSCVVVENMLHRVQRAENRVNSLERELNSLGHRMNAAKDFIEQVVSSTLTDPNPPETAVVMTNK